MNKKPSQQLLEKNPALEMFIEQGRFLTGYTSGGQAGEPISIFLCHSPWTNNCLQATAGECIAAGEVIVISDGYQESFCLLNSYVLGRSPNTNVLTT